MYFVFSIFTPIYSNLRLLYRYHLALFRPCDNEARITSRDEHMQSLFLVVCVLCYQPLCCNCFLLATVFRRVRKTSKSDY
jgi:hypothetical protein